jgi:hypothetical protein
MTIGPDESVCEAMEGHALRRVPAPSRRRVGRGGGVISMRDLAKGMATS